MDFLKINYWISKFWLDFDKELLEVIVYACALSCLTILVNQIRLARVQPQYKQKKEPVGNKLPLFISKHNDRQLEAHLV